MRVGRNLVVPTLCSRPHPLYCTFATNNVVDEATPLFHACSLPPCQVEIQRRKGESIPKGWAVDGDGEVTEDPNKMLDNGGLLYLGGSEETGGYKGYGLGMMVEVLGGILGGGAYGKNIRYWKNDNRIANLVSFIVKLRSF